MRRTTALILVVLSHAGAIYWFHVTARIKRVAPEQLHWRGELIFIAVEADRSNKRPAAATSTRERRDQMQDPDERAGFQASRDDVPQTPDSDRSIDWFAQGTAAANSTVARQNAEQAMRSLDSKPQTIELPKEVMRRREGTTQRFDDGEMITWISERCYVTNRPPSGPQLIEDRLNVVCKNPGKPRDDLFDRFRPHYLGGPKKPKRDELAGQEECPTLCQ
jgi:hypothetical protein